MLWAIGFVLRCLVIYPTWVMYIDLILTLLVIFLFVTSVWRTRKFMMKGGVFRGKKEQNLPPS